MTFILQLYSKTFYQLFKILQKQKMLPKNDVFFINLNLVLKFVNIHSTLLTVACCCSAPCIKTFSFRTMAEVHMFALAFRSLMRRVVLRCTRCVKLLHGALKRRVETERVHICQGARRRREVREERYVTTPHCS